MEMPTLATPLNEGAPSGTTEQITNPPSGNVVQITNPPSGIVVQITNPPSGNVVQITDPPSGSTEQKTNPPSGSAELKTNPPSGIVVKITNPPSGSAKLQTTPPSGTTEQITNPPSGNVVQITNPPSGSTEQKTNPPSGSAELKTNPPSGTTEQITNPPSGIVVKITNPPSGSAEQKTNPPSGNVVQITNPPSGNVVQITNRPSGVVVQITNHVLTQSNNQEKSKRTKQERHLRAFLRLYFNRPCKWKDSMCSFHIIYLFIFVIQIVKISLLTRQMYLYGNDRAKFNSVVRRGHLTLRHLLLENWDASWETVPYPPAHGDFAVYTIDDLESGINFAVSRYYNAERDAIGFYKRIETDNMKAIVKYFDFPGFQDADVDKGITISEKHFTISHGLTNVTKDDEIEYNYSIVNELEYLNLSQPMKRMLTTSLEFTIHSVRPHEKTRLARCLRINGKVTFTDIDNNGQVAVDLETTTHRINCEAMNVSVDDIKMEHMSIPIGKAVFVFCIISIILTVLTDIFGVFVFVKTKLFMGKQFKQFYGLDDNAKETDLPKSEYFRFALLKFWDIPLLISDALTINGTYWIVFATERSEWGVSLLNSYTVILGIGCILAWLSLLRFFRVHKKFHLLFSTLSRAIGDVIAYMMCVSVLFVGFWFCGYVVLGPYHVKFRTPAAAAETLFALVNGDEIFATIAMFEEGRTGSYLVWWFARFYIGVYVSIYTIVVINLLIALFMSAYEAIKTEPEDRRLGQLELAIQNFIMRKDMQQLWVSMNDLPSSTEVKSEQETKLLNEIRRIVKINKDTNKVEIRKPITLKTFIRDEEERRLELSLCCCKLALNLFIGNDT